ncbi:hypothetical protein [Thalassotalea sp. Y01]|uniref:hypothetical protein n=1 Tax=Thalassotalea sp. Y01 TaxID=2729613 RepID=UPI00145D23B6|nr:hypothetical protein [Thalassotalea sp. Y01]NMP15192.1 hypothetical protein [Thalassotalea sp. Y01]
MQLRNIGIALVAVTLLVLTFTISALEQHSWRQVGKAKLEVLFWDVYQARLYTPDGNFKGIKGPLKLHLTYYIDIDGADLAEETGNQWQEMQFEHADNNTWLRQLKQVFPDLQENDSLTMVLDDNDVGYLLHNENLIYRFEPSVQLNQFLAIWLSDKSTRPKLMTKLTGQNPQKD